MIFPISAECPRPTIHPTIYQGRGRDKRKKEGGREPSASTPLKKHQWPWSPNERTGISSGRPWTAKKRPSDSRRRSQRRVASDQIDRTRISGNLVTIKECVNLLIVETTQLKIFRDCDKSLTIVTTVCWWLITSFFQCHHWQEYGGEPEKNGDILDT